MHIPLKTLRNGFTMPSLGIGTWRMGGKLESDPGNDDDADIAALRRAIEAGVTHIDTAEMYGAGHAERIVGHAIEGYSRENLFIASKVLSHHLAYDDVLRSAEESLKKLRTDYLDLYMIHHPSDVIPIEDTMRAFAALVDRGVVRAVGVSNFSLARLQKAQTASVHPIVVNQVHYNLTVRDPEQSGLSNYAREHDLFVAAWRPLEGILQNDDPTVRSFCEKYGKTPPQIALNWLISQDNVTTIAAMRHPDHLAENIGSVGWTMDAVDIESLRRAYRPQVGVSPIEPMR